MKMIQRKEEGQGRKGIKEKNQERKEND